MSFEKVLEEVVRRVLREELERAAKPATPGQLVSVRAYAEARSISPATVRTAIRNGRLEATRIGNAWRVRIDAEIGEPISRREKPRNERSPAERAADVLDKLARSMMPRDGGKEGQ